MADPIAHALTAEEWATFPDWHAPPGDPLPLYFPTKHGIAAANLHNEPFGFTQADVEFLRNVAADLDAIEDLDSIKADSLANRVAALLPPAFPVDTEPTHGDDR